MLALRPLAAAFIAAAFSSPIHGGAARKRAHHAMLFLILIGALVFAELVNSG